MILEGQDATNVHVREREVGFVFQHYALFRHMTVYDNVAFGLRVRPRSNRPSETEIKKRVTRLLDLVQLAFWQIATLLIIWWSASAYCACACLALNHVLLLDEPFGALDAKVRKELRRWLRTLHDELHITSIFVTHDQKKHWKLQIKCGDEQRECRTDWFTT